MQAGRDLAEKHYAVHKGKPFYDSLLQVPDSRARPWRMVWEGREAVAVARTLMGPTDGTKAPPAHDPRRLRPQRAEQPGPRQRQCRKTPTAEIALWFKPEELVSYQPTDAAWVAGG